MLNEHETCKCRNKYRPIKSELKYIKLFTVRWSRPLMKCSASFDATATRHGRMEILTWKEDRQDPVVERDEREPDDGRGEEVEEVLQQLNGDVVRRKGLLVDVGRVEIRDDRIVRGRVSRDGRLEDGVEPLVDGCVGQPEHGAHEEVEEILRLD